jgi:nucleoside-diphosphate-sugar epimerase
MPNVLISGGTGYIGRRLVPALLTRGHEVGVLARRESLSRVPSGATAIPGNALNVADVLAALSPDTTIVHLVGTPHPSPSKAAEFQSVDLPAALASIAAAAARRIPHLVYVSVAHPAPVMEAYIASRVAAESAIARAGLTATVLRPWYVLGPGHRWPIVLRPVYGVLRLFPATRATAQRLGLVTIDQMVAVLVRVVEDPPPAGIVRVVEVREIREAG